MDAHYHPDMVQQRCGTNYEDGALGVGIACLSDPRRIPSQLRMGVFPKALGVTVGVHPTLARFGPSKAVWRRWLSDPNVLAVGEVGLDLRGDHKQTTALETALTMAHETDLPVVFHARGRYQETVSVARRFLNPQHQVYWHCFNEDTSVARALCDRFPNSTFGFNTLMKKSEVMRTSVAEIPISKVMLESDAPFFGAPEDCVDLIASLKSIAPEMVRNRTTQNTCRFYRLAV